MACHLPSIPKIDHGKTWDRPGEEKVLVVPIQERELNEVGERVGAYGEEAITAFTMRASM